MKFICAAIACLLVSAEAMAHAILIDSQPAPQGHARPGRVAVMLKYNSRIDAARSKLTLDWPDRHSVRLDAAPGALPDVLTASVELAPGDYVLRWQVLAIDGHLTRGRVPFTVDPAGPGPAGPAR